MGLIRCVAVGGQGIASGFRDAIALSWRLAMTCRSNAIDFDQAFTAWYRERKQQLEASLAATVRNGDMVTSQDPLKIFVRDWGLWLLQLFPTVKRWLELGPRNAGAMQYTYEAGMAFIPELGGGICFPQVYCTRLEPRLGTPPVWFTDDVVFADEKKAMFQIVVLVDNLTQLGTLRRDLDGLDRICARLSPTEASFFVRREGIPANFSYEGLSTDNTFRIASAMEFESSPLCTGRPPAIGYREGEMWKKMRGKRYIIVRLDRFVFAACKTRQELDRAAQALNNLFPS